MSGEVTLTFVCDWEIDLYLDENTSIQLKREVPETDTVGLESPRWCTYFSGAESLSPTSTIL